MVENLSPANRQRYQNFIASTQRLAERHRLYMTDEARTIADCYELRLGPAAIPRWAQAGREQHH